MKDFRDFRTHNQIRYERLQKYRASRRITNASLEEGLGDWRDETEHSHHYHDGWEGRAEFIGDRFGCSRGLRNNCDCCQGEFHFGAAFWHELATMVVLDVPRADALLGQFNAFGSELGRRFIRSDTIAQVSQLLADATLSAADRRVIVWQGGWRFESPELVLEAIASRPDEAKAFSQLRGRVFSPLKGMPYNEWPSGVDLQFDAERVAHLAMMLLPLWRAPLSQWQGGSATDLLQHLLALKSEVPALLSAVMSPSYRFGLPCAVDPLLWLVAESQGASIRRSARYYGVRLSSKQIAQVQALRYLKLDGDEYESDLEYLLMYHDLQSMGGTHVELRRIHGVFYANEVIVIAGPDYVAFWRSTVVWLIRWRDQLTDEEARSILSWALHRYTEDGYFSFSRRTVSSALGHTREYEREIDRSIKTAKSGLSWAARGWGLNWCDEVGTVWRINELTDQLSLAAEGAVQSHCVGGYAMQCAAGSSAILQLLRDEQRAVTIEVRPEEMRLAQALGRFNSAPSEDAMAAVRHWANHFGISV